MLIVVVLNVVMLSVVMLIVVMLSVVIVMFVILSAMAPLEFEGTCHFAECRSGNCVIVV